MVPRGEPRRLDYGISARRVTRRRPEPEMLKALPIGGSRAVAPQHETRHASADFGDELKSVVRVTPRQLAEQASRALEVPSCERESGGDDERSVFESRNLPIDRLDFA